jgi:hypothetical protein
VRTLPASCLCSRAGILTPLIAILLLSSAMPPTRPFQQPETLKALAVRLTSLSAVTGYEQALGDTLLGLLRGSVRDRAGNVLLESSGHSAGRLVVCPIDESGYVVGGLGSDGYLTLRRVPGRVSALFDQQLEGQRVTIQGSRGPVPGVVGVRSIHLTRGREAPAEAPFTVDNAYVDVGAASLADLGRLGIKVLAPVTLAKRPHRYGTDLLAAPAAGRRAACAALLQAVLQSRVRAKTLLPFAVAFVVEQELSRRGLSTVANIQGPFRETVIVDGRPGPLGSVRQTIAPDSMEWTSRLGTVQEWSLPVKYAGTAVETVSLTDADSLRAALVRWIGGDQ